ncbi:type I restriction endonuclease subunit S [Acinetobacter junii]|uniref:Restriction endonuclease subunit S n=1 Tax=Acinetobacter junii TaxID=40215 RepID=A0ABU8ZJ71_ACIJU|nr:restriction endonuclease subunit S [Acinetobacter junii]RTE46340.1 type I restriction endonuclease subunit S [Acinetobacter junii]
MSEISFPDSWAESSLSSLISIQGLISDGDWVESKDQDPSGLVRLIQLADIGDGDFRDKSDRYMTHDKANALNCTYLKQGDVLIARMPDPLGRACIFPGVNQDAVTVVDVCLIRTGNNSAMSNELLKYWINSPVIRSRIELNASGTTRKRITRKKLEEFNFPVPPLAEQKVIVDKLDNLLSQVESIKARLERIPEILKQFRQSVLAAAVSGKLTEEWRETSPTSDIAEMLSNIVKARESVMIGNQKRGIDFTVDEHLKPHVQLPRGWDAVGLGNLIEFLSDYHANGSYEVLKKHVVLKEQKDYACMIRATNFEKGNFDDLMIYIDEDAYNFLSKTKLYGNEILISKIGNAGSVYFMLKLDRPCSLAMNLFMLRFNENLVHSKYIYYFLISSYGEKAIQQYVRGVATKSIDKKSVRNIFIYLPSFDEQLEIVKKIEKYFDLIDAVESQVKNSLEKVNNLTQSILSKAFRGELTAGWREANPELISGENSAEALLERIKAERSAKSVTKPGRGKA